MHYWALFIELLHTGQASESMRAPRETNRKEQKMTRKLKALGVALVAASAVTAVTTEAASATGYTSTGPVTLIGKQTGTAAANQLSAFGAVVRCTSVTYTGHEAGSTTKPKALIPVNGMTATITPHYSGCTAQTAIGEKPVTVKMTSCDYTFFLGLFGSGTTWVNIQAQCAVEGDQIHVEIYNNAAHTELVCSLTFGPQTRTGGTLSNTAGGLMDLNGTFTGISATRSGLCLLDGQGSTTTTATLATDVSVEGKNAAGVKTEVSIS
jgi:hypothetical protein